jgi:alpha-tubulin suppressor-like RCC1 family protein
MNSYGQCGVGSEKNLLFFPLTFKQRITKVAAGLYHSAFVDELGVLYTCGRNVEGQLGIQSPEKNSPDVKQPQKVDVKWPIESIACGNYHTSAVSQSRQMFETGRGQSRFTRVEECGMVSPLFLF